MTKAEMALQLQASWPTGDATALSPEEWQQYAGNLLKTQAESPESEAEVLAVAKELRQIMLDCADFDALMYHTWASRLLKKRREQALVEATKPAEPDYDPETGVGMCGVCDGAHPTERCEGA